LKNQRNRKIFCIQRTDDKLFSPPIFQHLSDEMTVLNEISASSRVNFEAKIGVKRVPFEP
jgi:hypothetical protein